MKHCTITGTKCMEEKCRQFIHNNYTNYCKVNWLRSTAIKLEGLADLITSVVKLTDPTIKAD